ncbi:MAG: PAQR family membrane homeostasis protein TrhA [Armatimonadota bacterium]
MRRWNLREPVSGLSHLGGAGLSVVGLVALLSLSPGKPWHLTGFAVYGGSLVLLYLASALYHLLPVSPRRVGQLHMLDQIGIYLLIAGTYTPLCLVSLRGPWGWSLLGVVWGLALVGITLRVAWRGAPHYVSLLLYLVMGWLCVVAVQPLVQAVPPAGLLWLVLGGLLYSVGAIVFATERPRLWPGRFGAHDLWHCFVLGGSGCHYVVMAGFVAPTP